MASSAQAKDDEVELSRPERKRRQRERRFVDAAKTIVADDGFEGLTMARLAEQLDTVVSAVYRYFPSKAALLTEVQKESIERLAASLAQIEARGEESLAEAGFDETTAATARLVLIGRWLCAASQAYPEDLRLLLMIMSKRHPTLDEEGGERIFPIAMSLLGRAVAAIDAAQQAGAITEGDPLGRAVIWSSGLGGVIQTDDLESYLPDLFGQTRLARQANLDLLRGWGASDDALAAAGEWVASLADDGPLAP